MRISSLTIAVATLVGLGTIAGLTVTPRADADKLIVRASSTGPFTLKQERCPEAQKAISFYRQKYKAHREKMDASGPVPRVWYACDAARRRAVEWRKRAADAKVALEKWIDYHYNWRSWLPHNWYLVGSCETGYGGDPNWEHSNSSFTSAFGISWREYNANAAYMGAPPWHVRHTPRDQYMAALGHYARFGDGWTCPGP